MTLDGDVWWEDMTEENHVYSDWLRALTRNATQSRAPTLASPLPRQPRVPAWLPSGTVRRHSPIDAILFRIDAAPASFPWSLNLTGSIGAFPGAARQQRRDPPPPRRAKKATCAAIPWPCSHSAATTWATVFRALAQDRIEENPRCEASQNFLRQLVPPGSERKLFWPGAATEKIAASLNGSSNAATGKGRAEETPIGRVADLDTKGLNIKPAQVEELLSVDLDGWRARSAPDGRLSWPPSTGGAESGSKRPGSAPLQKASR